MFHALNYHRTYEIVAKDKDLLFRLLIKQKGTKNGIYKDSTLPLVITLRTYFLRIPFKAGFTFENIGTDCFLHIQIDYSKLVRIIIYGISILTVLSIRSIPLFLIVALIYSSSIFLYNSFQVMYRIRKIISPFLKVRETEIITEELIEEQIAWMKDSKLCPACGFELGFVDTDCPECGLKIKLQRDIPVDHTPGRGTKIRYFFRGRLSGE